MAPRNLVDAGGGGGPFTRVSIGSRIVRKRAAGYCTLTSFALVASNEPACDIKCPESGFFTLFFSGRVCIHVKVYVC